MLPPPPLPPVSTYGTSINDVGVDVVKPDVILAILIQNNLSMGMYGDEVLILQQMLQNFGYFPATQLPTRYFGIITRNAVIGYQRANNIPATGFVGPLTRALLNGNTSVEDGETITINLWFGSRGSSVIALQRKLQQLGYFPAGEQPTGYFGSITRSATVAFQEANGIPATGYVGPLTRTALAALAIPPGTVLYNAELRYKILQRYPNIFFCDPDFYPIPRFDEIDLVRTGFPEIKSNAEEFQAIVRTLGFGGKTAFSDEDKLAVYREHKKLSAISLIVSLPNIVPGVSVFTISTGDETSGERIEGTINAQGIITVIKKEHAFNTCPICLSKDTHIDTPQGAIRITDLKEGIAVWTTNASGTRVVGYVEKTSKTPVPPTHEMVHITLADDRELLVSPGHPTADGRTIRSLAAGYVLDGSKIISAEQILYKAGFTYDILPSGETGTYFANGILLGSTLR